MNWWEWLIVGCACGVYLLLARHAVRWAAWSNDKKEWIEDVSTGVILLCILLSPIIIVVMIIEKTCHALSVTGAWVSSNAKRHQFKFFPHTVKRIFPPLTPAHKDMARKHGGW